MSNSRWNADQGHGERALREAQRRDERDRELGARLRSILAATGHTADSLAEAEREPNRTGLADFTLRLVVALREEERR